MLFKNPPQHTLHKTHYVNLQVDFKYGELVGCFKSECELPDYKESSFCIIRKLELMELLDESITNSWDCPLLTSTTTLQVLPTSFITCSASIIHECGQSCNFTTTIQTVSREREHLDMSQLTYVHDYSITTFCMCTQCPDYQSVHSLCK